jgi:hypothetical protein
VGGGPADPTWFHGGAGRHPKNVWQTWTIADPHATPDIQRETLDGWFIDILPTEPGRSGRVAVPRPERAVVGGQTGWTRSAGHAALRSARFWSEWSAALHREYPKLTLLGEMFDGDPALVSYFQGGVARDGIDSGSTRCSTSVVLSDRRAFAEGKPLRGWP